MKTVLKINLLLISLMLVGCRRGPETSSSSQQITTGGEQSTSITSVTEITSIPTTTKTVKLITSGSSFGTTFPAGTQFSSTEQKEQNSKLVNYFNNLSSDHELISSIDCESCASQFENKKDSSGSTSHLTFGTQKSIGSFTLNLKYYIKEIKVNAQAYFSFYEDYQNPGSYIYNVDVGAKLKIESQEFDLEAEAGKPTIAIDRTFILDSANKSIILGNVETDSHRVFINSIEITYFE